MGEDEMVLRAETTDGSYTVAEHILRNSKTKPPLGVWQLGQSFRRELSDGANAANLRFNSFYQLEFQLIYSKPWVDENQKPRGTQAPIPQILKDALLPLVQKMTGLEARIVPSRPSAALFGEHRRHRSVLARSDQGGAGVEGSLLDEPAQGLPARYSGHQRPADGV
jgi:hypothetical protein